MSKVYAVLLVLVALNTAAAIGTLRLVVVTDVGYLAYRLQSPERIPEESREKKAPRRVKRGQKGSC
jgi:hypothetical protein